MNDFSELEAELKQLRPAAASPRLVAQVERAFTAAEVGTRTAGVSRRPKIRLAWLTLGLGSAAAAAALLLLALGSFEKPHAEPAQRLAAFSPAPRVTSESTSGFVPDGLTRVVYQTRDEGLIFPRTVNEPVRRTRSRTRETLQWKNPGTGASLRVSYPAVEVEFIPVSGQ
ncbi:MAG: hypothetical protein ACR2ID_10790 [Chthoniobacterales bacterium]